MKKLETIYLDIDEENIQDGIDAISLVKFPAIEENWVALNEHKVELKTIDEDKRIVIGLALIPEKDIYRRNGDYEYNIRFSKETVTAETKNVDLLADTILIKKSQWKMELYAKEKLIKDYKISLGFAPIGPKQQEGDGKTPEDE